jgi:GT2 family glycosyltransferase
MSEVPRDAAAMGRAAWERGEVEAAAGNISAGRRWLERARRMVPADRNLAFALGLMRLRDGDPGGATILFQEIATVHGGRESWAALVHCALAMNDVSGARSALLRLLSAYALDPGTESLAARLLEVGAISAWCGLRDDGSLGGDLAGAQICLDGRKIRRLPSDWHAARAIEVRRCNAPLFGSPIDVAAISRTQGFVRADGGTLSGWAWHPHAPDTDPVLHILDGSGALLTQVTAHDLSAPVSGAAPLARPRGFSVSGLPHGMLRVLGRAGRDLLGSPLSLTLAALPKRPRKRSRSVPVQGPVCIVMPVHSGLETTLACIDSVLAARRNADRVVVVNDASPDPALVAALTDRAGAGDIELLSSCPNEPGRNIGFPGAANTGMRAAVGQDVLLLNSDTLVFAGWIQALQHAAHSAPDIGTATPLSNDASIFSYPDASKPNPMPSPEQGARLASLAATANAGLLVEVPTAHGFCMFIRADCLAATGPFREDVFSQGYGEENDFTERARLAGYRHVAVPEVYVAHIGGVSFGAGRMDLLHRNLALLDRMHPTYAARVAAFMATDLLRPARTRLDTARLRDAPPNKGAVLLVTHGRGGGTARVVRDRIADLNGQGFRPILLVGQDGMTSIEAEGSAFPNLSFALPNDMAALVAALAPLRPAALELHQLLGHDHSITALARHFAIPTDIWLHDYGWLCPRVSFVTGAGRFCGEAPPDVCEICVAESSRVLLDPIAPADLRRRSAADLAAARQITVSDDDVAIRLRRHFPGIAPVIRPWENDNALPARETRPRGDTLLVAVVGAIGLAKGFETLLACARDAAARALPLSFIVIGYTNDDQALLDTGRAFVTGEFAPDESTTLIRTQRADMAFLPSVWPETWCYALTDVWKAGLDAAVFDIGVPAARVRRTGRGWVLPLGLPAPRVNEALLNLQPLADRSVPQHSVAAQTAPRIPGAR